MGVIFNIEESVKNSGFNILQEPIKMILDNEVEAFEKQSIIPEFFVMKTTDRYLEEYRSSTSMDGFKPTEDMEVANISDFEESYFQQFTTQTWTNSFVISKQTLEDNKLMNIDASAMGFIKSYGRTRELYAVAMIGIALGAANANKEYKILANHGKGMDTVDGTIEGTRQQYFHNAHRTVALKDGRWFDAEGNVVEKGTPGAKQYIEQSNKFVVYADNANTKINFADGITPDLEEKVLDAIGQVEAKMAVYRDDKGNIVPVDANKIIIGKNYRLVDIITRGLKSRYGASMDGNGINTQYGKYKVIVNPYLSAVKGFRDVDGGMILMSESRNREGLGAVWFDRKPLEVRSYKDDKTEANVWAGRARFGAGYGDFRAMSYISIPQEGAHELATSNATKIIPTTTGVKAVNVVAQKAAN
jgi:hypothetical protein